MGDNNSASNGNLDVVLNVNDDATKKCEDSSIQDCVPLLQKVIFLSFSKKLIVVRHVGLSVKQSK
jgi:hypothetical protein